MKQLDLQQLNDFCDFFALDLVGIEYNAKKGLGEYDLYVKTIPDENSPLWDPSFPSARLDFVGIFGNDGQIYLRFEDRPEDSYQEISDFTEDINEWCESNGMTYDYDSGTWIFE